MRLTAVRLRRCGVQGASAGGPIAAQPRRGVLSDSKRVCGRQAARFPQRDAGCDGPAGPITWRCSALGDPACVHLPSGAVEQGKHVLRCEALPLSPCC
ncbi:hypothetical protein XFF6992_350040 [Xanthomonas citri pv. fuscans]|nr:hypothetical protein XFF6992_350040 [Xanthomonas citri pv. fuscans]SOO33498.1 hypothetical protein XFF6994_2900002 [Xanthomonas citri pv. fuscans]